MPKRNRETPTTEARSALMRRVRKEGTKAEVEVRRMLHGMGARFRVNVRSLPGSPDIANRSKGKAIFVHGCFWHYHSDCPRGSIPRKNRDFWKRKLEDNRERDLRKEQRLSAQGFDVLTVWECELTDKEALRERLIQYWFS